MDNIVQIDAIRIERHKPRKCVCDTKKFTVDTVNREITCQCGIVHDPFEAMLYMATHYEKINNQHKALYQQNQFIRKENQVMKKDKPSGAIFKELEQQYNLGRMLPMCPCCGEIFHFKDIKRWTNSIFYKDPKKRGAKR